MIHTKPQASTRSKIGKKSIKQTPRKVINELIKCQRHFGNHKGDYKDKVPKLLLLAKYK